MLADGTYRVDGVAPGEWTITGIAGDSRKVSNTVVVEADAAVAILDLDFSRPGFDCGDTSPAPTVRSRTPWSGYGTDPTGATKCGPGPTTGAASCSVLSPAVPT